MALLSVNMNKIRKTPLHGEVSAIICNYKYRVVKDILCDVLCMYENTALHRALIINFSLIWSFILCFLFNLP